MLMPPGACECVRVWLCRCGEGRGCKCGDAGADVWIVEWVQGGGGGGGLYVWGCREGRSCKCVDLRVDTSVWMWRGSEAVSVYLFVIIDGQRERKKKRDIKSNIRIAIFSEYNLHYQSIACFFPFSLSRCLLGHISHQ